MEQLTVVLIGLFVVLLVGHFLIRETFKDVSGTSINLSLTDLMAVLSATVSKSRDTQPDRDTYRRRNNRRNIDYSEDSDDLTYNDAIAYMGMRDIIKSDIHASVGNQLKGLSGAYASAAAAAGGDAGSGFPSSYQGQAAIRAIPGRSPADDYIRKDSIPCYACSLPE